MLTSACEKNKNMQNSNVTFIICISNCNCQNVAIVHWHQFIFVCKQFHHDSIVYAQINSIQYIYTCVRTCVPSSSIGMETDKSFGNENYSFQFTTLKIYSMTTMIHMYMHARARAYSCAVRTNKHNNRFKFNCSISIHWKHKLNNFIIVFTLCANVFVVYDCMLYVYWYVYK
jgi:hypothetical protein